MIAPQAIPANMEVPISQDTGTTRLILTRYLLA
jgi:hypothetical protein